MDVLGIESYRPVSPLVSAAAAVSGKTPPAPEASAQDSAQLVGAAGADPAAAGAETMLMISIDGWRSMSWIICEKTAFPLGEAFFQKYRALSLLTADKQHVTIILLLFTDFWKGECL